MVEVVKIAMELLKEYGPGLSIATIFGVLFWLERKAHSKTREECQKKNDNMADKLVNLSTESIKADTEHTAAISSLGKIMEIIGRRI